MTFFRESTRSARVRKECALKLAEIPGGSEVAYREAVKIVTDQLIEEVQTCVDILGVAPDILLAILAQILTETVEQAQPLSSITIPRYFS